MNNDIKSIFLYRIMSKRYIPEFSKGAIYFSCCGKWIAIAKTGGGKGQGDRYEGVFAKYQRKNSRKPIQHYKKLFGKDLIVESEDDYYLLRRKSSLYIPAICFYSIDTQTILQYVPDEEAERLEQIAKATNDRKFLIENFPLTISDKYFEEFNLDSDEIDAVIIQPKGLFDQLKSSKAYYNKVKYIDTTTEYDIFSDNRYKQDFGMTLETAISTHIEIFYKDKNDYGHQCEFRAILPQRQLSSINKGVTIKMSELSQHTFMEDSEKPINANGIDFICNVKNQVFKADIIMKKK